MNVLLQPEAIPYVAEADYARLYREQLPEYIILTPHRWVDRIGIIREQPWFTERYVLLTKIGVENYFDSPLSIYQSSHSE